MCNRHLNVSVHDSVTYWVGIITFVISSSSSSFIDFALTAGHRSSISFANFCSTVPVSSSLDPTPLLYLSSIYLASERPTLLLDWIGHHLLFISLIFLLSSKYKRIKYTKNIRIACKVFYHVYRNKCKMGSKFHEKTTKQIG